MMTHLLGSHSPDTSMSVDGIIFQRRYLEVYEWSHHVLDLHFIFYTGPELKSRCVLVCIQPFKL